MLPLEQTILRQLFADKEYAQRVVPYLKEEYFPTQEAGLLFRLYDAFFQKYKTTPKPAAIRIGIDSLPSLNERSAADAQEALKEVEATELLDDTQSAWLIEETEDFCQERAVYCALQKSIQVMDDPKATRHVIPDLMKEALAVSFDNHVGHKYFDDADARHEFYHKPEARLPFDLDTLNAMTGGGVPKKTLNVVMAGTNVGKSLFLCHVAAAYLRMSKRVLYISMEMGEEVTAQRIDANLFDIPMDDVEQMPRANFVQKILNLRNTSTGELVVKQYPTGAAHSGNFRSLLHELHLKQNFVPDVVIVDYLTICASARVKMGSNVNSYTLYKFVAEELRGIAVEFEVPLWTAAQFNRTGHSSSDPSITDIGESWAIAQTADFMFALVQTDELEKLGQLLLQPMKNRYRKKNSFQQEMLGVNTDRMKLYELSASQKAQTASMPPPGVQAPSQKPSGTVFGKKRRPLAQLKKEAAGE